MGSLRFLFALAVVLAHSWGSRTDPMIGGPNAVLLFYMVSGFLISLILTGRNSYHSLAGFYLNRYLRIWPTYAVVAVLALVVSAPRLIAIYQAMPSWAAAALAASNILIVGQDWLTVAAPQYKGMLVPPAWTLGVELTFYAIAPFVLSRRWLIWTLLLASAIVRVVAWLYGGDYRTFPFALGLFLIGALAHQIGLPLIRKLPSVGILAPVATGIFALLCVIYPVIPVAPTPRLALLVLLFAMVLPLAFLFQNKTPWDKRLGEISYPLYICHWLVIQVISHFTLGRWPQHLISVCAVIGSLVFALALDFGVVRPIERIRDRVRARAKA